VSADTGKAAEAQAWLERIEDENAGELTPERIAQMESAGTPEGADAVLEETEAVREVKGASGPPPVLVSGRRFKRAN
jgi:(E)-4-hydroxy-3-methylbut-2-enyl-diphosphate synthase